MTGSNFWHIAPDFASQSGLQPVPGGAEQSFTDATYTAASVEELRRRAAEGDRAAVVELGRRRAAAVSDALAAAHRGTSAWPPVATITEPAPEKFIGMRVKVLDQFQHGAHVQLVDAPACTTMNVPAECLDLEGTGTLERAA
jgi:hypothetical protein